MPTTLAPEHFDALPPGLRDLAHRHHIEQCAAEERDAAAARAALAQLDDTEADRLLTVAARLRGEAEALRRKAEDAERAATEAHAAYTRTRSDLSDQRTRLRRAAVAPHRLAEAYRVLEEGAERLRVRYRVGRRTDRAGLEAIQRTTRRLCADVLDLLRDGVTDPPTRDLLDLVRETLDAAEHDAREAVAKAEEAQRDAERRADLRRLFG
jgi:predicted nuclease with TOPRIM domain